MAPKTKHHGTVSKARLWTVARGFQPAAENAHVLQHSDVQTSKSGKLVKLVLRECAPSDRHTHHIRTWNSPRGQFMVS